MSRENGDFHSADLTGDDFVAINSHAIESLHM